MALLDKQASSDISIISREGIRRSFSMYGVWPTWEIVLRTQSEAMRGREGMKNRYISFRNVYFVDSENAFLTDLASLEEVMGIA